MEKQKRGLDNYYTPQIEYKITFCNSIIPNRIWADPKLRMTLLPAPYYPTLFERVVGWFRCLT